MYLEVMLSSEESVAMYCSETSIGLQQVWLCDTVSVAVYCKALFCIAVSSAVCCG